jgi:endonuclease I
MAKRTISKKKINSSVKLIYSIISLLIIAVGGYFGYSEFFVEDKDPLNNQYEDLPIEEYYQGAEGLNGIKLKNFLNQIVSSNIKGVKYSEAKVALAEADVDPSDSTKVLTIYSRDSVTGPWTVGGTVWAREHVWPNSRLGLERVEEREISQASDLHNLRAIVPRINSSRSNKIYDVTTDENSYYPGEYDKGDVARILFYMATRYPILELVDIELPNDGDTNYTLAGAKMGKLKVLLQWHLEDPVDDFERHRNEIIYKWQSNRNPFIDHPEFADKIFGDNNTPLLFRFDYNNKVAIITYRKETFIHA